MKIAIPITLENNVDQHFGHCAFFSVFTINENQIISKESIASPPGCGCKSNIALQLKDMSVDLMLAGNMGEGAVNVLNSNGISVIRGCSGNIDTLVKKYLNNEINDSGESCSIHQDLNHQCN